MINELSTVMVLWLATYALHGTLLLGAMWIFDRVRRDVSPSLRSTLWRSALLAPLATATLHVSGIVQPLSGEIHLSAPAENRVAPLAESVTARLLPAEAPRALAAGGAFHPVGRAAPAGDASTAAPPDARAALTTSALPQGSVTTGGVERTSRSVTPPQDRVLGMTPDWPVILLTVWLLCALVLGGRIVLMLRATRHELDDRRAVLDGPLFECASAIARGAGLERLPRLSSSARIEGPLTLPSGEICIPISAQQQLSPHQLDAMLAHEMAHWLRRDAQWLVAGSVVQAMFFFQPLNWLACRRLAVLAELAADDWSATWTGRGLALAECLAMFAQAKRQRPTPAFATAMARKQGALVHRIERLLSGRYGSNAVTMRSKLVIGTVALLGIAALPGVVAQTPEPAADSTPPGLPAPVPAQSPRAQTLAQSDSSSLLAPLDPSDPPDSPDPPDPPDPPDRIEPVEAVEPIEPIEPLGPVDGVVGAMHSIFRSHDGDSIRMSAQRDDYSFEIEAEGDIALEPDASGIASLGVGAYLDVTVRRDGALLRAETRRVRFEGENGEITREFWLDGASRPWGTAAEPFVEEVVLLLFRTTGISAPERVAWLLDNGGPERLLDEIAEIESDSVQRLYSELYAESGELASEHLRRLVSLASVQMGSDSQLRAVLTRISELQRPAGADLVALIDAGRSIGSDSQTRALLEALGDSLSSAELPAYLSLTETIGSDSQVRAALTSVVRRDDLSDEIVGDVLMLAGSMIGSDSQLTALLGDAARRVGGSETLALAYLDAAEAIGSDSQARAALLALAEAAELNPEAWRALLRSARHIGSDSQSASLLVAIAEMLPRDEQTLAEYRRTAEGIGSSSQASRAERALN